MIKKLRNSVEEASGPINDTHTYTHIYIYNYNIPLYIEIYCSVSVRKSNNSAEDDNTGRIQRFLYATLVFQSSRATRRADPCLYKLNKIF